MPRVHCFVETGERVRCGEFYWQDPYTIIRFAGGVVPQTTGMRSLPDDWLEDAWTRFLVIRKKTTVTKAEILDAILGPEPEPEPEPYEREAAEAWEDRQAGCRAVRFEDGYAEQLARHFAKARRGAGK